MKKIFNYILGIIAFTVFFSFALRSLDATTPYKCMLQMSNYSGEGAYIVVSVVNDKNEYVKTLKVFGDDKEYFPELKLWWKSHQKNKKLTAVDAISGETIAGGQRQIFTLNIPNEYLNQHYSLKFESAVEDNLYKPSDVVIPLDSKTMNIKQEGKGYIRYVRLIPIK